VFVRSRGLEFDVDATDDLIRLEQVRGGTAGLRPSLPLEAHG